MCVSRQRWPGRVAAGAVTDEIVAAVDWLPTLASMVGESARVPDDRPIDGIDASSFSRQERHQRS
jgi:arylsulfatase